MNVGEVRVADDSDFQRLRNLCEDNENWKQEYQKQNVVTVWSKNNELSDFKMVKVQSLFTDIAADVVYDVLHDPDYRKMWDKSMIEGHEICMINPNNDIGYYALKLPPPLRNRDFVNQRSWLVVGSDYFIMNHSVFHEKFPPRKGIIRGVSYLTGYMIKDLGSNKSLFTYVTQSDPKGKLPAWAVNKATQILAPKVINRIAKACKSYEVWKSQNRPHYKPWLYPEQSELPKLQTLDVRTMDPSNSSESIDESGVHEEDLSIEEEDS